MKTMAAQAAEEAGADTVVRAACPHDCPDTCAMLARRFEQQS